jgi:hypothetical protein
VPATPTSEPTPVSIITFATGRVATRRASASDHCPSGGCVAGEGEITGELAAFWWRRTASMF